jgi:cytosine/adenosine deaminase-related metal-dependent hydrolase
MTFTLTSEIVRAHRQNKRLASHVAKTLDEDKELLEAGFEYVTERDGVKIYRKRK